MLKGATPLKSHATFVDGHDCPGDRYLRLHFQQYFTVSACGGNPTEDYKDQEIDLFMEELGVYDELDTTDHRWTILLGVEVYAYLVMAIPNRCSSSISPEMYVTGKPHGIPNPGWCFIVSLQITAMREPSNSKYVKSDCSRVQRAMFHRCRETGMKEARVRHEDQILTWRS